MQKEEYDFPVELRTLHLADGTEVPMARAVYRPDEKKALSVVSNKYQLIRYRDQMDQVLPFLKKFGKVETSYALERDGARMLATHTFRDISIKVPGHKRPG